MRHDLVEEPRVDAGGLVDLLDRRPAAQRLLTELIRPSVGAAISGEQRSAARTVVRPCVAVPVEALALCSSERSAFCSASVKLRPMAIASPTDFIVVVSVSSAAGNFSNANRGTLTTT
jgi:hypothetical protein